MVNSDCLYGLYLLLCIITTIIITVVVVAPYVKLFWD